MCFCMHVFGFILCGLQLLESVSVALLPVIPAPVILVMVSAGGIFHSA